MKVGMPRAAQTAVNEALRAVVVTQPAAALWREASVAPVCAVAAARRAWATKKFPGLKVWVGHRVGATT